MLEFDLTINIITLLVIMALSAVIGFGLQRRQIAKKNRKIMALEQEVVQVSAEILDVQKEYCTLEARVKDQYPDIPVIPIKLRIRKEDEPAAPAHSETDLKKDSKNRTA